MDYYRCKKKWYWRWRKGLFPKAQNFGALSLGTWMHVALSKWYLPAANGKLIRRWSSLPELMAIVSGADIELAQRNNAPEYVLEKAEEQAELGIAMAESYEKHYGKDTQVSVIGAEIPAQVPIVDTKGELIAIYRLKPDLVFRNSRNEIWLMEHKTAAAIRTEHLVIDGQARPYGALAEIALHKAGAINKGERIRGILYNFIRKAFPDDRKRNEEGQALNQDGSVSKRQPAPLFHRHPVVMGSKAKLKALKNIRANAAEITFMTQSLRSGTLTAEALSKTPHWSCPKFCDFFPICTVEEEGGSIVEMTNSLYERRNPYEYDEDSTDDRPTFEMGS